MRLLQQYAATPAHLTDGSMAPEVQVRLGSSGWEGCVQRHLLTARLSVVFLQAAYVDVVRGNIAAVAAQSSYPYCALPLQGLLRLIARNVPAAAAGLGLQPGVHADNGPAFPAVAGRAAVGGWVPRPR